VNHPSVLIVAQDPAVARDIVSRWQSQAGAPSFTLMSTDFPRVEGLGEFDLAIIQAENGEARHWESAVDSMAETVVQIAMRAPAHNENGNGKVFVSRNADWLANTVLVGTEMLRRVQLVRKLRKLEGSLTFSEQQASLGQYMLDARHDFNNALTSVLGNAELLMLSLDRLPPDTREQVETVHAMAIKLYELMQRFASLESEMRFEQKGTTRLVTQPRSAAYGS
jgi:signal transduction histidine kinase